MGSFRSCGSKVEWSLDDSTEALSDRLIWSLAVRSQMDSELDDFLLILKKHGTCKVMIQDSSGQEFKFSFQLPIGEFAQTAI